MQKYEAVEFQQFSNWYHKLCFATPLVKKKFQNQRHFENLCPEIEMFIHRPSILKPMEISYAYFLPSLNFQVISCMISRVKATRKSSNELSPSNDHNGNDIVKIAIRNLSLDLRTVINSAVITFFKILHFRILVRFDFDKFCFESGFTIRKNYYSEFSYIDRFSLKKFFLTSFKMTRSVNKSISYDRCKKFSYKRFESKRKTKKNLALKEIKFYQKTTGLLINKLPFMRIIKEILEELKPDFGYRWQANALLALQEMAEAYIVSLFEETNFVASNANRVTIKVQDMQVVRRIRGHSDIINR